MWRVMGRAKETLPGRAEVRPAVPARGAEVPPDGLVNLQDKCTYKSSLWIQ